VWGRDCSRGLWTVSHGRYMVCGYLCVNRSLGSRGDRGLGRERNCQCSASASLGRPCPGVGEIRPWWWLRSKEPPTLIIPGSYGSEAPRCQALTARRAKLFLDLSAVSSSWAPVLLFPFPPCGCLPEAEAISSTAPHSTPPRPS
jgi:hypothetical protein